MPQPATKRTRSDSSGRAFAGSQRQIQFFVNEQPKVLQNAISHALHTQLDLRWVSPLRSDKYREYRDFAFLKALGLSMHRKQLNQFWPSGGPRWDALAVDAETGGVLLVEAKSHCSEIFGNGCGAKAYSSIQKIDTSLAATKKWLKVSEGSEWKGSLYQTANRIAHLHFFRNNLLLRAWLVNLYFIEDPHSPTSQSAWEIGVAEVKKSLKIGYIPFYADVFVPASETVGHFPCQDPGRHHTQPLSMV